MTGLFISWTRENGRTTDLAHELGLEAHFIYLPGRFGLPSRYLRQLRATRRLLATIRPQRVIFMLPPAPVLLAMLPPLSAGPKSVVFDLHTGFFGNPKWRWLLRPSLRLIRRLCGTAIVTNEHLQAVCREFGVEAVVLHDVLKSAERLPQLKRYVLCPLSYANDEPVDEIIAAARATPDVEWRLTGRAPEALRAIAPPNVTFTGFVGNTSYAALVANSLGVIALTTRPHTMQRAGYEAFSAGVPQVTSNFPELRDFYGNSAEYAEPYAADIAAAVRRLAAGQNRLESRLTEVRQTRIAEQQHGLIQLRRVMNIDAQNGNRATSPAENEDRV